MPLARIKDDRDSEPESGKRVLLGTAQVAALLLMRDQDSLFAEDAKLANDSEAIPRAEAFDRLLRAQAANERSLNLAIENFERHQRRREGEAVPSPVSIRLSR